MLLHEWIKQSRFSVRSFAKAVNVERAMLYRYFAGSIPRTHTIHRIELLTDGAVTAQDFYQNAMRLERADQSIAHGKAAQDFYQNAMPSETKVQVLQYE